MSFYFFKATVKPVLNGNSKRRPKIGFDFEIYVNFPFLDGDVPRSTSYGVYISQLIGFDRASSHVAYSNTGNKLLTQKLLKQGYRYHKLPKTFSKFYRRYYDLISKFQVGLIWFKHILFKLICTW